MRQRISQKDKIMGNFANKAFLLEGKYYVRFKNPVVIGSLKDIMILPPKQNIAISEAEDQLEQIRNKVKIIIEKINQIKSDNVLTDQQKLEQSEAYNKELREIFKKEAKNREQGQQKIKFLKPKVLRCRVTSQNAEGFYEIEPLKLPKSWLQDNL